MDPVSIVNGLLAAQMGQTQLAVAAKMLQMNADQADSVAKLIDAAQQNASRLADVAKGVGQSLDISA